MDSLLNFMDKVPFVGHVKGFVHLASGDEEAAKKAFYESTRSTAVVSAGALGGIVAGPAGAAAFGTSVGFLSDSAHSIATDEPQGVVKNVTEVCEDISNGEVPILSVVKTSLAIGQDAIDGVGVEDIAFKGVEVLSKII